MEKGKKAEKKSSDLFLRDFAQAPEKTNFPVLRDFVFYISSCLVGFIAHTHDWDNDLLLRDSFGTLLNRFYDRGIALSLESKIPKR